GGLRAVPASRAVTALADGIPGGVDGIPATAEAGQAFTVRLARLGVLDEVVEGMSCIGDLDAAVTAPARAEQPAVCAGDCPWPALGDQRRPVLGAVAVTGALRALVMRPDVQRLAV